ncbi:MAG: hypothetical protein E5X26_00045 [Mesorhizobium sp.]|nr:MAG: hypothetical protein E5X26_00045 [Mesorhizobium sp.]
MSMTGIKDEKSRARNIAQKITNSDDYGRKLAAPSSRAGSLPQGNAFQCGSEPARDGGRSGNDELIRHHRSYSYPARGSQSACTYR